MSIRVDMKDGRCRTCGSQLEITDADDATLLVTCIECDDSYELETDALGDGCMTYYPAIMAQKLERGESE